MWSSIHIFRLSCVGNQFKLLVILSLLLLTILEIIESNIWSHGVFYIKCTPVSGALHRPWPFCQYKFRLKNDYHVKQNEKLHWIPSMSKVGFSTFFNAKNEKIVCKSQFRLARITVLGLYESSEANSPDDAIKSLSCMKSLKWGKGRKYCLVLES